MKRRIFIVSVLIVACGSFITSCIGPFALSSKLLAWNQTISNKFINALVFIVISPVYGLTLFADAILFNSIEFWTGNNPIQAGVVKQVQGENGIYTVETLEDGYRIENEAGQEMKLQYDKETNTWSAVSEGKTTKLLKIEDKDNAIVYLPNGQEMSVELSQAGILACRQAIENSTHFASK